MLLRIHRADPLPGIGSWSANWTRRAAVPAAAAASGTVDAFHTASCANGPCSPFTGRSALWPGSRSRSKSTFGAPLVGEARLVAYIVLCVSGRGPSSESSGSAMNQVRNPDVGRASGAGATLGELAEQLSELREHLDRIRAGLSDLREDDGGIRDAAPAASRRRIGQASAEGLRCHECGRRSSTDQAGWTLRLCGDDQLHPFCPTCDRRPVSGNGGAGPTSAGLRSSQAPAGGGR